MLSHPSLLTMQVNKTIDVASIEIVWTPGYSGFVKNEFANKLAKNMLNRFLNWISSKKQLILKSCMSMKTYGKNPNIIILCIEILSNCISFYHKIAKLMSLLPASERINIQTMLNYTYISY